MEAVTLYFLGLQNHWGVTIAVKLKGAAAPWKENLANLDSLLRSRNITFQTKVHIFKAMFFSDSHGWI